MNFAEYFNLDTTKTREIALLVEKVKKYNINFKF